MTQEHCTITTDDDGTLHAVSPEVAVTILPDGEARAFNRNGLQKNLKTGETTHIRFLVAELDGVRCYIHGKDIIMTRQDLYP